MYLRFLFLSAVLALASCAKKPAAPPPPEPFPNQPGALSAEELQAAAAVMNQARGSSPALPLRSSGKRAAGHPMAAYAVFAGESTRAAANVTTQRRMVCNYWTNANTWRCGSVVNHYEVETGGRKHSFYHYAFGVPEASPQTLAELADYALSACFAEQLKMLAGGKAVPVMSTIEDTSADANGLTMRTHMTTEPNSYVVRRLEPAQGGCGFQLKSARIGQTGTVFAEPAAK